MNNGVTHAHIEPPPRAPVVQVSKEPPALLAELFERTQDEIAEEEIMEEPPMTTEEPEPIKTTTTPNAAISRAVFGLLEDNLDEKLRMYRNGYSDKRVADEVGCHETVVRDIRVSAFCELVEDARLSGLRNDITTCERTLDKLVKTASDEIAALRSRLEQIVMTSRR